MKEKFKNCNPSICNGTDLMSNEHVFMTKDVIKEQCECEKKNTCIRIAELLLQHRLREAENLFIGNDDDI